MRQYSYLLYGLLFLVPWLAVWRLRPDLRRELWITSLVTAPLGPLFERWYHVDYWRPSVLGPWSVGVEDLLFGFGVGGLGAVAYEVLSGRRCASRHWWRNPLCFAGVLLVGLAAHALLVRRGVNSIYVSMAVFAAATLVMVIQRRDLLPVAIVSGAALATLMVLNYQIVLFFHPTLFQDFWELGNLSGRFLLRVPIEEPLWGFGWGAFIGCAWKYGFGQVCVPRGAEEDAPGSTRQEPV